MTNRRSQLALESLESRTLLTVSVGFVEHDMRGITSPLAVADLDGDGIEDLIDATRWQRVTRDGLGETRTFDHVSYDPEGHWFRGEAYAVDLDADGDLDLVTNGRSPNAGAWSHAVAWFENLDGRGQFGRRNLLRTEETHRTIQVGELNGDAATDLIIDGNLWINDGAGQFDIEIAKVDGQPQRASGQFVDFDNDGDTDILHGMELWENVDRDGNFQSRELVVPADVAAVDYVGDLDFDGRLDLIVSRFGHLTWLVETERPFEFRLRQELELVDHDFSSKLIVADVDGDSDSDIVLTSVRGSAEYVTDLYWLAFDDQSFRPFHLAREVNVSLDFVVFDFDHDRDLDIASRGKLHKFDTEAGLFSGAVPYAGPWHEIVGIGDIDRDGDIDKITALVTHSPCFEQYGRCTMSISWVAFDSSIGHYEQHAREIYFDGDVDLASQIGPVWVEDIDGDGDNDLLLEADYGTELYWLENRDGKGDFTDQLFDLELGDARFVGVSDLDSDGRLDLVLNQQGKVGVRLGRADAGPFGALVPLVEDAEIETQHRFVLFDWDKDGRDDLVAHKFTREQNAVLSNSRLVWYRRGERGLMFEDPKVITQRGLPFASFELTDIDSDGDTDIRSVSRLLVNQGDDFALQILDARGPLGDLDRDGLVDVGSHQGELLFNRGGANFDYLDFAPGAFWFVDLDGDSDLDILPRFAGAWYESRPIGDANGDGKFSSADIIEVMNAGLYDDDIEGNAEFETGDWNADGEFDSSDWVHAFAFGLYEV